MNYSVISAELEGSKEEILHIWQRNLFSAWQDPSAAEKKFEWHYLHNPYGPGRCWLLQDNRSGLFVGTAGLGMRNIKVADQVVPAGLLVDFAVDKEHRMFLPALLLQQKVCKAMEENVHLLYCAPNPRATVVLLRAGCMKLGDMVRYAKVVRAEPYLRRVLGDVPAAGALARPLNWALQVISSQTWAAVQEDFVAREIDSFDDRFDALWERAAPDFPVIGERTAKYLHWRYGLFPLRRSSIFGLLSRDESKLLGYIVCRFQGNTAFIVDLFFEQSGQVLTSLLSAFLRFAQAKNVSSVSVSLMGPDHITKALKRVGFRRRKDIRDVVLFVHQHSFTRHLTQDQSKWYLVEGEGDNG